MTSPGRRPPLKNWIPTHLPGLTALEVGEFCFADGVIQRERERVGTSSECKTPQRYFDISQSADVAAYIHLTSGLTP